MRDKLSAVSQKLSPGLRKIIGNIGWLFAERILTIALSLTVGVYVMRYLGVENFGKLSYSLSFVGIFSAIAKLGLDAIVVRDIIQEQKSTQEILGTAFILKLLGSLVAIALVGSTSWIVNDNSDIHWLVLIIAFGLLFSSFEVINFWFQSQVLAGAMTVVRSGQFILSSLAKLLLIKFRLSLIAFVWLSFIDSLLTWLGYIWVYFQKKQSIFRWEFNWSRAIKMMKDSWPLILSNLMITIYMKIDQVMLGNMVGEQEVGYYSVAVRFSEIWYFVPGAICSSVFPAIIRAKQKNETEYYDKLQQLYDLMTWISLAIAIPMTFISSSLIMTLLGKEYTKAGEILVWHIWASPFVFLGVARSKWLMTENLTQFSFATTVLGGIINILLNLFLIPIYGGTGSAIATLISYACVSHLTCILYPPMFKTAWMLTKALFIPFRFRQNWIYLSHVKNLLS
jgi:O-antigen/teichoic acid export membrane protein